MVFSASLRCGAAMNEVFIVDDDPSVHAALDIMLSGEGFLVTSFVEGESFLSAARARTPGCVLFDVHLPGCSGLDVLRRLDAQHCPAPILVISGRGDIPTAIDAIRNGALDFIEKPFDPANVVTRVRDAIKAWANLNRNDGILARNFPDRERLTVRERDVLERIARGASNNEAGRELGISPDGRSASCTYHGKTHREKRRRFDAHRAARWPPALVVDTTI
jgi:two-component system, LuxR family, response regulator FixJ